MRRPVLRHFKIVAIVAALCCALGCSADSPTATRRSQPIEESFNSYDDKGWTPLTSAAMKRNPQAVADLLRRGADPNFPSQGGLTPLVVGASNPAIVRALLRAGADPNAHSAGGLTALAFANAETATILLAAGAKIDDQDDDGRTALMSAAARGDLSAVKVLVGARAQLDRQDNVFGKSALMYAAQNGHAPVVDALVKAGADTGLTDHNGWTAAEFAALSPQRSKLRGLLGGDGGPGAAPR
jgi:ankyrin repeat protein